MNRVLIEDKTCRICGSVDTKNINIFDAKQKALLYKILTIFPITMYESDPLPKNICKKCYSNVTNMYDECQRIVKIQQKWIERVRINQPDHPYVKVLNIIEDSHQDMLNQIKKVAPDFIYKNTRLLQLEMANDEQRQELTKSLDNSRSQSIDNLTTTYQESPGKVKTLNSLSFDYDMGTGNYSDSNASSLSVDPLTIGNERRHSFKEIQHKLESNGCTLLFKNATQNDVKPRIFKNSVVLSVPCNYCDESFPNVKFLAKHQLRHFSISDRRIFDKKYLEKGVRRGRLIPVDDKKCIRCLNCWKLFEDNRKILEHWSNADCEFFCQICGMEFAKNPKQLREHVPEVHGITYKSSRRQVANIPDVRILNKPTPADVKPKLPILLTKSQLQVKCSSASTLSKKTKLTPGGRVICNLCSLTFPNYQSKNSHMRAHKRNILPLAGKQSTMHDMQVVKSVRIKTETDIEDNTHDEPEIPTIKLTFDLGVPRVKTEKIDEPMDVDSSSLLVAKKESPEVVSSVQGKVSAMQAKPDTKASSSSPEKKVQTNFNNTSANVPMNSAKKSDSDQMQYDKMYNCHPCGKKFSSKTDLFQHKKLCQSNNKFGCRFCLRAFVTSADLQMHIMLMHKGS